MIRDLQTAIHDVAILRRPNALDWIVGVAQDVPRDGVAMFRPLAVQLCAGMVYRVWTGQAALPRDEAFRVAAQYALAIVDDPDDAEAEGDE